MTYSWRPTNAPISSSRTDDIWFLNASTGWAVNSNGHILKTGDGGDSWTRQFEAKDLYLRSIVFTGERDGWVGTLSPDQRLFRTRDGGERWDAVTNLPEDAPRAICGLSAPDAFTIIGSGTNFPSRRPGIIRSVDGGETWTAIDMDPHATLLVDVHFKSPLTGWVVGGKSVTGRRTRDDVKAVVLFTEDGGVTWRNVIEELDLPVGEWGWKIFFVNDQVGYVSLESFERGGILRTTDGGLTWARLEVNDAQRNINLEGIGFASETHGWVGGWGDANFEGGFTSATDDSGDHWRNANEIGKFLNRFRFIREPELVGYAAGDTVYKFSKSPPPDIEKVTTRQTFEIPSGARMVTIDIWDRFGEHLLTVVNQQDVRAHVAELTRLDYIIMRITIDGETSSRIVRLR